MMRLAPKSGRPYNLDKDKGTIGPPHYWKPPKQTVRETAHRKGGFLYIRKQNKKNAKKCWKTR